MPADRSVASLDSAIKVSTSTFSRPERCELTDHFESAYRAHYHNASVCKSVYSVGANDNAPPPSPKSMHPEKEEYWVVPISRAEIQNHREFLQSEIAMDEISTNPSAVVHHLQLRLPGGGGGRVNRHGGCLRQSGDSQLGIEGTSDFS